MPAEPEYLTESTLVGSEREQVEAFLEDNRAEVLRLLDGLTEEQARRRLVPSKTSLLALVKHATFVEQVWFPVSLAGRSREEVGCPADADESFDLTDDDTIASVTAAYRAAAEESRRIAAAYAPRRPGPPQPPRPAHPALDPRPHGRGARPPRRPRRHPPRADPHSPDGPASSSTLKPASSRTGTPSCSALSALEPGLSPTTT